MKRPAWTVNQVLDYCAKQKIPPPPELSAHLVKIPKHALWIPTTDASAGATSQTPAFSGSGRIKVAGKRFRGLKSPKINKIEQEFGLMLELQKSCRQILDYGFAQISFVVGEPCCRYTPDYHVFKLDGTLRMIELKGPHIHEDSIVKFKAARKQYPEIEWQFWQKIEHNWNQAI